MNTQNITTTFKTILEAVQKSSTGYGKQFLIRMLLGWKPKNGQKQPDFFGKLADKEFKFVWTCVNYLFYEGYLEISRKNNAHLQISENGKKFLSQISKEGAGVLIPEKELFKSYFDFRLYEKLKECRNEEAEKIGVKPYVFAGNLILEKLSADKPVSLEALYKLPYLPKQRPVKFWQKIVDTIVKHELEKVIATAKKQASYEKVKRIKEEIQNGKMLKEIAEALQINPFSLAYYVEKLLLSGEIKVENIRDLEVYKTDYQKIYNYFKICGDRRLSVGNKVLGFSYDKLRIGRACYEVNKNLQPAAVRF